MNTVKDIVINNFLSVKRGTEFILKAIPMDKLDYAPAEHINQKLGDLARHIAILPFTATYFAEHTLQERPNPEEMKKLIGEQFGQDLAQNNYAVVFSKACEYFLTFYSNKNDDEFLNSTFTNFIYTQPTPFLKGFLSVEDHLIQHRGTLFAYLRVLNVPVTMKQYFGMESLH